MPELFVQALTIIVAEYRSQPQGEKHSICFIRINIMQSEAREWLPPRGEQAKQIWQMALHISNNFHRRAV